MGFYPDVVPGQSVGFSAVQENNLRRRLNALDGFRSPGTAPVDGGTVRVQVYNAGNAAIAPGTPVAFPEESAPVEDILPAVPVSGTDADAPFGVCEWPLASGEIGPCVLMGVARVRLASGGSGTWLQPDGQGAFARAESGTARLLYDLGGGEAIALLGCAAANGRPLDWDFSESFRPSLFGNLLSCTGGTVWLGSLHCNVAASSYEIPSSGRTVLSVVTTYANSRLNCAFSTIHTGASSESAEITRIACVDDGVLRLERFPGDIHIYGRWAYYDN